MAHYPDHLGVSFVTHNNDVFALCGAFCGGVLYALYKGTGAVGIGDTLFLKLSVHVPAHSVRADNDLFTRFRIKWGVYDPNALLGKVVHNSGVMDYLA